MASFTESPSVDPPPPPDDLWATVLYRLPFLLWLFSGMFSLASLALAFAGYFGVGAFESANANFLAALVAAILFGVASLLKFGPESA